MVHVYVEGLQQFENGMPFEQILLRGLFRKFVEFGHKMFKYRYTPFIF